MLPATLLLVVEGRRNLEHARAGARSEVTSIAQLVAEHHQGFVDTARGTLLAVARLPAVRALDGAACGEAAKAIAAVSESFANLAVSRPDGAMFCSAYPMAGPVNVADRTFFREALRTGDFSSGTLVVTRVRGVDAVGFGLPVRDAAGDVVAVASASLRADVLQRQLDELPVPPHVAVEVIDRAGNVVSERSAREGAAGKPFGEGVRRLALAGDGVQEGQGADGVRRVYAFRRVGTDQEAAFLVIAAVPTEVLERPVRAAVMRSMGTWGVAMLAVLVGAGFVAEFLLVRRLRAVSQAAVRIAGGDYRARTGLPAAGDELGQLVGSFDQMAESMDRLQRQNALLLDSIGDGIVGLDRDARVVFSNPAAASLLGIPIAELAGQPFASLLQRGGPRADPCLVQQSLADGRVHLAADDAFTRRDGRSFPVESVTTPIVDGGRIVGAVVALRDATERRRLEEELRQAQKMEAVGQLAGGVAHDFNNLLTAIITCARMVEDALPPGHPALPDVAEILSSADRAAQLTRQLLAFGRRQRLAPRSLDLRESVTGMERMLRRILGETISLDVSVPPEPVVILADPGQIEMVVLNLAVNARDAMASGGRLSISVGTAEAADPGFAGAEGLLPGPLAQLVVRDSGAGMDGETQERIFEPFFTTKPSGKGTGLGLATVYGIVKQSGGAIEVRSAPGAGAEFRVLLPLSDGAVQPVAPAPAPVVGGRERILVLEDDGVLRSLVSRALASAGYRVSEASRPSAALARLAEGDFDLVVTDLVLPEENGWSFFRRAAARRPGLRVLLMSGFSAAPEQGLNSVPRDVPFLPKPFAPHDLLARVRQTLDAPAPVLPPVSSGERAG